MAPAAPGTRGPPRRARNPGARAGPRRAAGRTSRRCGLRASPPSSAELLQRLLGDARVEQLVEVGLAWERPHRLVRGQQVAEELAPEVAVVGPGTRGLRQQLPDGPQLLVGHLRGTLDRGVFAIAVA